MYFIPTKYIANIFTFFNLFFWILSIILIFKEIYIFWIFFFLMWEIFDLFDWKLARKFGWTKNWALYDNIADSITFWFLPWLSIISVFWLNIINLVLSLIYILSVFFRLWRYLVKDKFNPNIKKWNFNWLPSPAWSIIILSLILTKSNLIFISITLIIISLLMISNIKFAHFRKIIESTFNKLYYWFIVLITILIIFVSIYFQNLDIFLFYIFISWIFYIFLARKYRVL